MKNDLRKSIIVQRIYYDTAKDVAVKLLEYINNF